MTWEQDKAAKMIEAEIESISKSDYPGDQFCAGLIQMAYALGLLDDIEEIAYTERASTAVQERRRQLRELKIQQAIRGTE